MSQEDLERHGVLLPREEWGAHQLETTVSERWLALAFALAVGSLCVIYFGAGGTWTWIGLVTFLIALYWIVWICDRAVVRQRRRTRQERSGMEG